MEQNEQVEIEQQEQQAEVETVSKEQYDAIVLELEQVKAKLPVEKSEEEIAIETKQQELFQKEVTLELKSVGLDKFADFFNAQTIEELTQQIEKFQTLLNDVKLETGYIPTDHKATNEFTKHEQQKNTVGMIGTKLAKLFN